MFRAGFEPATLCVWGTRDNRYTNETWLEVPGPKVDQLWKMALDPKEAPPGGLEPPTFRLTAERASQLRHGGWCKSKVFGTNSINYFSHNIPLK